MHKIPLTQLEEDGLRAHGLDIGSPSQLSDVFRHGIKWALDHTAPQPEQTAMSAVTAERDRLREQVAALQSGANSWQPGYDKGREDGAKSAGGWKDQHARDSAELRRLCAERDQLRVEVEALRSVAREFAGLFSSDEPRHWELYALADAAAMAAKESTHEE
ncbi:MAG: hypothetical protein B7X51_14795 [Pseudomonas sp. 34-62-33]|nr:MAG: hypothetical protein B7X51_14795 [Pseudomonas sp. 34-62-33]